MEFYNRSKTGTPGKRTSGLRQWEVGGRGRPFPNLKSIYSHSVSAPDLSPQICYCIAVNVVGFFLYLWTDMSPNFAFPGSDGWDPSAGGGVLQGPSTAIGRAKTPANMSNKGVRIAPCASVRGRDPNAAARQIFPQRNMRRRRRAAEKNPFE